MTFRAFFGDSRVRLHASYFSMIESGQETALASQTVIIRTYTELTKMERGTEMGSGLRGRREVAEERGGREGGSEGIGVMCVCGGVGPA